MFFVGKLYNFFLVTHYMKKNWIMGGIVFIVILVFIIAIIRDFISVLLSIVAAFGSILAIITFHLLYWDRLAEIFKGASSGIQVRNLSKRWKIFFSFAFVTVILIASTIFIRSYFFGKPSEITFNRIGEIFSYDSILVLPRELDEENKGSVVDICWVWGVSSFNRPHFFFDYISSKKGSKNLICLIAEDSIIFDEIKDKSEIEIVCEEYGIKKEDVISIARLFHRNDIDYLIISESEPKGLSVATAYLMNPVSWSYHRKDSILFFGWEDRNDDGKIQINEIIVRPKKNTMIKWQQKEKEGVYNPIFLNFENNTAIILGEDSDELDLISAGNITWSLGYYLRNFEKPGFMYASESIDTQNLIIIGGTGINEVGGGICESLDLNAILENGKYKISAGSIVLNLLEEELDEKDVCIIAFENIKGRNTFIVAGVGEFGTLAGSLFLTEKENWNLLNEEDNILILKWIDKNGDGSVEIDEISVENGRHFLRGISIL